MSAAGLMQLTGSPVQPSCFLPLGFQAPTDRQRRLLSRYTTHHAATHSEAAGSCECVLLREPVVYNLRFAVGVLNRLHTGSGERTAALAVGSLTLAKAFSRAHAVAQLSPLGRPRIVRFHLRAPALPPGRPSLSAGGGIGPSPAILRCIAAVERAHALDFSNARLAGAQTTQ